MFNIFKTDNTITFFTKETEYYKLARPLSPDHSGKFLPEWYKQLSTSYETANEYNLKFTKPTIKSCFGIKDLMVGGIIIPMWSDLIVDVYPDKSLSYQFSDSTRNAVPHIESQFGRLYEDCTHLKLVNPWGAKTTKSRKYYYTSPFYHVGKTTDFYVCPGMLDFYYSHSLNVNLFFKVKPESYRITIPVGFPLVQIISTDYGTDKIKIDKVSEEAWEGLTGERNTSFFRSYHKMVKFIKGKYE